MIGTRNDATKKQPQTVHDKGGNYNPYVLCYTRYADPEWFIASYDPGDGEWYPPYSTMPTDVEYWWKLPGSPGR